MKIPADVPVIVTVYNHWAKNKGVEPFLHPESSQDRGDSTILIAKVADESGFGLWVELLKRKDDKKKPTTILIPWSAVVAVVMGPGAEEQKSAIGFTG